jgi:hypothetical protein
MPALIFNKFIRCYTIGFLAILELKPAAMTHDKGLISMPINVVIFNEYFVVYSLIIGALIGHWGNFNING